MRLALFQPDIPQNTGTLLRLGACLDVEVDIIEPCGYIFSEKTLKRAGMDYLDLVKYRRHHSWEHFLQYRAEHPEEYGRIVLLTTKASEPFHPMTSFLWDANRPVFPKKFIKPLMLAF